MLPLTSAGKICLKCTILKLWIFLLSKLLWFETICSLSNCLKPEQFWKLKKIHFFNGASETNYAWRSNSKLIANFIFIEKFHERIEGQKNIQTLQQYWRADEFIKRWWELGEESTTCTARGVLNRFVITIIRAYFLTLLLKIFIFIFDSFNSYVCTI